MNQNKFYLIEGCLAYNTYEKKHTTSFCYIMLPDPSTISEGNQNVPSPSLGAYGYSFITCPSGFGAN
jgi:hypothetical protein